MLPRIASTMPSMTSCLPSHETSFACLARHPIPCLHCCTWMFKVMLSLGFSSPSVLTLCTHEGTICTGQCLPRHTNSGWTSAKTRLKAPLRALDSVCPTFKAVPPRHSSTNSGQALQLGRFIVHHVADGWFLFAAPTGVVLAGFPSVPCVARQHPKIARIVTQPVTPLDKLQVPAVHL